eukprot:TRINITY_DN10403_c0_g1_i1.p1 TRINITY_DN10403_c0_g1~~TRINITY_DN10403_c0_g1_i1.p1  ORF type:complete len:83 (-),score=3.42 TRINITY_DN10403_c0_g1_i1:856-1104(-)
MKFGMGTSSGAGELHQAGPAYFGGLLDLFRLGVPSCFGCLSPRCPAFDCLPFRGFESWWFVFLGLSGGRYFSAISLGGSVRC